MAARVRSALPGENPSPPPRRQLPSTWTSRPEPSCVCSSRFCLFRGALLSRPWLSSGHSPTGATAELPGEGLPLEDPCRSGGEAGATVTAQGDIGLALPARALGPFAFLTVALGDPGGPCAICTWQARTWGVVLEASILGPCAHSSSHGLEARSPGLWGGGGCCPGLQRRPARPLSGSRCFAGRLCLSLASGGVSVAPAPPAHGVPPACTLPSAAPPPGGTAVSFNPERSPLTRCSSKDPIPSGVTFTVGSRLRRNSRGTRFGSPPGKMATPRAGTSTGWTCHLRGSTQSAGGGAGC